MKENLSLGLIVNTISVNLLSECTVGAKKLNIGLCSAIYDTKSNGVDTKKGTKPVFNSVASNCLSLNVYTMPAVLSKNGSSRALFIPFDNNQMARIRLTGRNLV